MDLNNSVWFLKRWILKISCSVCSALCLACVRRRHRWVLFNKSAFIDLSENRLLGWRITRHRSSFIYLFEAFNSKFEMISCLL